MATAHLSDHPTPPPLPPSTRLMDRAPVNSQATTAWSWPTSRKTSTTGQTPPAIDTNVHFGGVELDPTFTAQRPASSAAHGDGYQYRHYQNPPPPPPPSFSSSLPLSHARLSPSVPRSSIFREGNVVTRSDLNVGPLNNPIIHHEESRSRPSISVAAPRDIGMANPSPVEDVSLLTTSTDPAFQGEKPLSARSVEQSNNAYDQSLLSKLGGPESARSSISSLSGAAGKGLSTLPFHSKSRPSLAGVSLVDTSVSPRDEASPPPFPFSSASSRHPSIVRSTLFDNISYQNPSAGNVMPTSIEVDPLTRIERRSTLTKHSLVEDNTHRPTGRLPRRSYDVSSYQSLNNPDGSFPRHLSFDESRSRRHENMVARIGIKRRASSPPRETNHPHQFGFYAPGGVSEIPPHRNSSAFSFGGFTTPGARVHGSVSSLSSYPSYRNPSLASSTGFSAAASSMTSVEGPLSPMSDIDSPYENIVSPNSRVSISGLSLQARPIQREMEPKPPAVVSRKLSTIPDLSSAKSRPTKVGQVYICECCSKKHRKFGNLEDLRAHEMEKQYPCQYCHKRFKNRNEAERHRNSLHLRRHSWSCAALQSYQAAFHPSSATSCQTPNGPSRDVCGFCGEEFSNFPEPDWEARIEHLTSVHKYRECNQSKKFYRADHFRQHLRHSHAGTSGKWTNTLENACMREEAPGDATGLASIGEQDTSYHHNDAADIAIPPAVHPSSVYSSQRHAVDDVGGR